MDCFKLKLRQNRTKCNEYAVNRLFCFLDGKISYKHQTGIFLADGKVIKIIYLICIPFVYFCYIHVIFNYMRVKK